MLNSKRQRQLDSEVLEGASISNPLQHLVDCHDRIEERLQTLEGLIPKLRSEAEGKRREAREELERATSFLDTMGALHTEDEEQSIFPRLLAGKGRQDTTLAELTAMLESQHREKEAAFQRLVDHAATFPPAPAAPSVEQVKRLDGLVAQLADLYRPHIMVENERLIPLCSEYLLPAELDAVREEMRARWRRP